jgi:2,3-bisphosphoglycerate-independent phosphoglycerate mutase
MSKKAMLVIMDGWGLGQITKSDAIKAADTPFVDSLYSKYPNTTLITCGELVGLPEGQMGNSEVGHLNLGAGRIVYQELQRINVAIRERTFQQNPAIIASIDYALQNNKPLHLLGLISDGGVHSHINHVKALISLCKEKGLNQVFIHAFTDGRDTDPKSGLGFIMDLQNHLDETRTGKIASVTGRYYGMDRDKRWERVKIAWDVLVKGIGKETQHPQEAILTSYQNGVSDEFILPISVRDDAGHPIATIKDGDAVLAFNFRTDRCREITEVLTQKDHPEQAMHALKLHYTTMTEYDKSWNGIHVAFETDNLENTIGDIIAAKGLKQIRIAETEKYPHVTFFFSGGREQAFEGEKRIIIQSPKVATYDLQPEMSAREITATLLPEIQSGEYAFICLNFANTDMVGHTGVWNAAIVAAETVDDCVRQVVTAGLVQDYTIFLTADHGNSDYLINENGSPNTAHTLNPVPLFVISNNYNRLVKPGKLGDIAPSILKVMGIEIPKEMTGDILVD